ncbi:MAG: hypothetical protein WAM82_01395 [Thermoanaerobaculia bacterium]
MDDASETHLHFPPDAAANFRENGQRLIASLKSLQDRPSREAFRADRYPTATFTEKDIIHIGPRRTINSITMEISELAFHTPNGLIGLVDSAPLSIEESRFCERVNDWIEDGEKCVQLQILVKILSAQNPGGKKC